MTRPRSWEPVWSVSERARILMGPEEKRQVFGGWRLSEPEPVREVPIRYELAYGGLLARPQEGSDEAFLEADERNPVGCGWIDPALTPIEAPLPAPRIEAADAPVRDPHHRHAPVGFGPIPPAWLPRRPLGGIYDAHWMEQVWPNWPADYDFAYHNSAHLDLVYPGLLRGDETVILDGLHAAGRTVLRLPGGRVLMQLRATGRVAKPVPMADPG